MKKFLLYNKDEHLTLEFDGVSVSITDVLKVYPDRRVYAFRGKIGAGKTTFIKALCEQLGVEDIVNSPTFAIVNVYQVNNVEKNIYGDIYHFDCYRLKNIQEAIDFGAEEYLYSGNYCFIEWPEMIEQLLDENTVNIFIENTDDDNVRILKVE